MERLKKVMAAILLTCMAVMVNTAYAEYNRENGTYKNDNETEFGAQDDFVVLGTSGTWLDPDVEIYGFSVFGVVPSAKQSLISASTGNVAIAGNLLVASTAYIEGLEINQSDGVSKLKFTGAGDYRDHVLRLDNYGNVIFSPLSDIGDHLGNHIATRTLDMAGYPIIRVSSIGFGNADIHISTATTQFGEGNGIYINTNVEIANQLYVGNAATLANTLTVGGAATLNNTLTVYGAATLNNTLTVADTANFNGNVTIGDDENDNLKINSKAINLGKLSGANTKVEYKDSNGEKTIAFFIRKQ